MSKIKTTRRLNRIERSVKEIAETTGTNVYLIVKSLVGICWDEEEAGENNQQKVRFHINSSANVQKTPR